jgi:hypothetical protein
MAKNKKKSKGPQGRNKNAEHNQVNAAPKKEKKPEQKTVEAKAEKAVPKEQESQAKAAPSKAEASKEKSFLSGIVDSVKKLVKA